MISFRGALNAAGKFLSSVPSTYGWDRAWGRVYESFTGAWQTNTVKDSVGKEQHHTAFACVTLIASDISKLPIFYTIQDREDGSWNPDIESPRMDIIREPNHYQNRIQFIEHWIMSKLLHGNTYVLKERDLLRRVIGLKILDPKYVQPLVSDDGQVFYQLNTDNINGIDGGVVVPADEIIHDRFNCFYHPLVGLSPLYAAALAIDQGLSIQKTSLSIFQQGGQVPGILTAPGKITKEDAERLRQYWQDNYTGQANSGKVAVLSGGLKFESMSMTSVDSQLIDQLKWTDEVICSTFHVPAYMVGVGDYPSASDMESLNIQYYTQCLQVLIESLELALDIGTNTGPYAGYEVDVESLLRMNGTSMATYLSTLTKGSILNINEARRKLSLPPVDGGNSIYMQQQNFSLEALQKRDGSADPFGKATTATVATPSKADDNEDDDDASEAKKAIMVKMLTGIIAAEIRRN